MNEKLNVDIWGCCISRDIIGIGRGGEDKYRVLNFYEGCSKIVAFTKHVLPDVLESERDDFIQITGSFGAFFKWYRADHDKTIPSILSGSDSKWIIIDFRSETYDLARVYGLENSYELLTVGAGKYKKKYFESKHMKYDIIPADLMDFEAWFGPFIDFCVERYGDNIILVEARESMELLSKSGKVEDWPINSNVSSEYSKILMEYRMNYEFKKRTNCHVIKCPHNIFADDCHKWGKDRVHYVSEYYDYCVKCLDIITGGSGSSDELDEAYFEICYKLMKIRCGEEISRDNTRVHIVNCLASGQDELALDYASRLAEQGDIQGIELVSQHYLDKKNVAGLSRIKPLLECYVGQGEHKLHPVYYDVLKRTGAEGSVLLDIAKVGCDRGDPKMFVRYARILNEGTIVDRDIDTSVQCYEKAISKGYSPARNELFELIWSLKDHSHDGKLSGLLDPLLRKNNPNSLYNYGRMLRVGRGVDKDLEGAASCFEKSAERGFDWANISLIDTLREIGNDAAMARSFEISKDFAEKGNMNAKYRLGLAYENGWGTPVDLSQAAKLYEESQSKVPQASEQLKKIKNVNKK